MKYIISIFTICLFLCSCKREAASVPESSTNLPDSFVEFYIQFHTDSVYQLNHIVFPLEGIPHLTESTINPDDFADFKWKKEDWVLHKNMNETENNFNREYREFAGMISETISHSSNTFSMTRRFAKISDEWHLIYYAAMNRN